MALKIGTQMPSLEGATEWLNATGAHAASEAKGHPTLVHFWAVSCTDCQENLARIAQWRDHREGEGLRVIAVHTPRDTADMDAEAVRDAITSNNMTEPCAVDNEHRLRDAFENAEGHVPAYYLFDAEGKLRSSASGESGLSMIAPALERLLSATPPATQKEQSA